MKECEQLKKKPEYRENLYSAIINKKNEQKK